MTNISTEFTFRASHKMFFNKESPDNVEHEHDWVCIADFSSDKLNDDGIVEDFNIVDNVKKQLHEKYLNEVFGFVPTTERLAIWIGWELGEKCCSVTLKETPTRVCVYNKNEKDREIYLEMKKLTHQKKI